MILTCRVLGLILPVYDKLANGRTRYHTKVQKLNIDSVIMAPRTSTVNVNSVKTAPRTSTVNVDSVKTAPRTSTVNVEC